MLLKAGLHDSQNSPVLLVHSDYVIQFEEDQFQPGVWHDHSRFPGSVNSAVLHLSPYVNYQFRVIAVNEVGSSHPSLPSERYRTSGAREYLSFWCPVCTEPLPAPSHGNLGRSLACPRLLTQTSQGGSEDACLKKPVR